MSRASKLASARGQAHTARHTTTVARDKLRRVTDERDRLRAEVERLQQTRAICPTCACKIDEAVGVDVAAKNRTLHQCRKELLHIKERSLSEFGVSMVDENLLTRIDGVLHGEYPVGASA